MSKIKFNFFWRQQKEITSKYHKFSPGYEWFSVLQYDILLPKNWPFLAETGMGVFTMENVIIAH